MGFSRPEPDSEYAHWGKLKTRLENDEDETEEVLAAPVDADDDDDDEDETVSAGDASEPGDGPRRPGRARVSGRGGTARKPLQRLPRLASPEVAERRLPAIKRAAERMKRLKKAAIDPGKRYRMGQRLFDPTVQRFGEVVYTTEGYVRLDFGDGTGSAHGRPPLEDRRAFVHANFERMDNRTMSEILGISVHTMRRLCHEYGLKRHGKSKGAEAQSA